MTSLTRLVRLGDLDLLLQEARDPGSRVRLRKLGFRLEGVVGLESARERLAGSIGERWMAVYERARHRYGLGVAVVRQRVCQGCFITLPTCATSGTGAGETPGLCACCGRVLFWG
jgi:predicted  nucleic acid-binding Zn-ribbon protein